MVGSGLFFSLPACPHVVVSLGTDGKEERERLSTPSPLRDSLWDGCLCIRLRET